MIFFILYYLNDLLSLSSLPKGSTYNSLIIFFLAFNYAVVSINFKIIDIQGTILYTTVLLMKIFLFD